MRTRATNVTSFPLRVPSLHDTLQSWLQPKLQTVIPDLEHIDVLDVTDGHAATGFFDGSSRSLDPEGLEIQLTVVSSVFDGLKMLHRQRLVGKALSNELKSGTIHAFPKTARCQRTSTSGKESHIRAPLQ